MDSELTNRCNSACPLCPRTGTFPGGVSKAIHESGWLDISLNHIDNICQHKNLKKFSYCGNYGDPVVHPKAFDIFKRVSENGIKRQRIHTNGSIRSEAWWKELGSLDGDISVVFGLDGLKDTLPIYRVNCDFDKVIANAKAFMSAGGIAEWQFIVFEHNEHQVDDCQQLAQDMGFQWFRAKVSKRHQEMPVDFLHPPKGWQDPVVKHGNIRCQALEDQSIYINAHGKLYPCCYLGPTAYTLDRFAEVQQSWDNKSIHTCVHTCSANEVGTSFTNQWQREIQFK